MRVYNFSAGPSQLPLPVLEQAQRELLDYQGTGMSITEMSHRTKTFMAVNDEANALLRKLMNIPDDYSVLFVQGGASQQFAAVPLNLLKTGKAEYPEINDLSDYKCMEYLRASGSLPFLSKNVVIDNTPYLDGGVADSVPVEYCLSEGYDKIIIVLTRPYGFRKKSKIRLTKLFYKNYPEFCETLKNRNAVYSKQYDLIDELEKNGEIFVIRPTKPIKAKATEKNPHVINSLYDLGRNDCKDIFGKLIQYLEK